MDVLNLYWVEQQTASVLTEFIGPSGDVFIVQPDRSYSIVIHHPPVSYYLRLAAGLKKGAMQPGECRRFTYYNIYCGLLVI